MLIIIFLTVSISLVYWICWDLTLSARVCACKDCSDHRFINSHFLIQSKVFIFPYYIIEITEDTELTCFPISLSIVSSIILICNKTIKSVTYISQGNPTGQLDFYNWLADGSTTG